MSPVAITLLVIVIVLAIIIAVLYFLGKKAQKKQAEQQELLDANKQTVSMICDEKIFDSVPVKKEVKAVVSGIYVLDVKGLHGKTEAAPEKKKGFFKRLVATAQEKAGAKPVK